MPSPDRKTRQQLLELVYDLLSQEEAAELSARIETDPELAQAYAVAKRTAGLFADGARIDGVKIDVTKIAAKLRLKKTEQLMSTSPDSSNVKHSPKPVVMGPGPGSRAGVWIVCLAASVLLIVSLGSYWWHREQLADIASAQLRLVVTGPSMFQPGMPARYTVATTGVTGEPMPSRVELAVVSPAGKQLLQHKDKTDEDGNLAIIIPADLNVPGGSRLEVLAVCNNKLERMDTQIVVENCRFATRLATDKPLYRPGETVFYRSLTLSRFGLADGGLTAPIAFEILDPAGAVVPGSKRTSVTKRGVGCGEFQIPAALAGGEYTLGAKSPKFAREERQFFIRRYRLPRLKKELEFQRESYAAGETVVADLSVVRAEGGAAAGSDLKITATIDGEKVFTQTKKAAADGTLRIEFALPKEIARGAGQLAVAVDDGGTRETIAKTIPINLGKVVVEFFPEGGQLVAGLENRVYFTACDPLGEPIELEGKLVDAKGNGVARVETSHEGMGAFSLRPRAGEAYRLEIDSPKVPATRKPQLPTAVSTEHIVLTTGSGVFKPDEPLEFNVRARKAGLPLVASAWCRGVPVGQAAFVTQSGPNSVSVLLAEAAAGVIRLTIYDYSASPPRPLAERLVYRRRAERLRIDVTPKKDAYSPGEPVELSLAVSDETGAAVPGAVLGVGVVDDALLNLADDKRASMPTHFLLTTEVKKPQDLEDADFYLSDSPDAPAALDLLLGTQGWRRFVERTLEELKKEGHQDNEDNEDIVRLVRLDGRAGPPTIFDNMNEINSHYEASLANYRADRTRFLNAITVVGFFAGLALVLLVAMLSLLGVVGGMKVWVPSLGAATACVVVGAVLMNPDRLGWMPRDVVAFASFSAEPKANASVADDRSKIATPKDKGIVVEMDAPGIFAADLDIPFGGQQDQKKLAARADIVVGMDAPDIFKDGYLEIPFEMPPVGLQPLRAKKPRPRFLVRQYAHKHRVGKPGVRSDFAETLYWHPLVICDERGKAKVKFELSDSVTTFRVSVDGHTGGHAGQNGTDDNKTNGRRRAVGRIGSGRGEVVSRIPFSLEPKLPLEVSAGDRIDLPVAVANDTNDPLLVRLKLEHGNMLKLDGSNERKLELEGDARAREYFTLEVVGEKGQCELTVSGTAGDDKNAKNILTDAVKRRLSIVPPGFPQELSHAGRIDGGKKATEIVVELPQRVVPGSLAVTLSVFPSALADLRGGLEGMLREPSGCFEQASTSNYPNVLSLQYLQDNNIASPEITRRARRLLKNGYVKLTGYESKDRGYEWFGGNPGHEALTAYGLLQFRDMAKVYPVDGEMIDRTAQWLIARRDGKGGFQRNDRALDSFGRASKEITDAYIVWALAESGQDGIAAEVAHVVAVAEKSDDPYLIALAASAASKSGKGAAAKRLLKKLAALQDDDGHLTGTNGSITRSGGRSLAVETTALAALAWLAEPQFTAEAGRAVRWITENRQGSGSFGSTQATILALRALIQYAKANRHEVSDGKLVVELDGKVIDETPFAAGQHNAIVVDDLAERLKPGKNRLTLALGGDNRMPYAIEVSYRSEKPSHGGDCPLRLSTKLSADKVAAGSTVKLHAKLVNTTDKGQPMTIAIIGLPAGLEARADQLEELKKSGAIDYYETRARELIFYWRSLAPKRSADIDLDLIAAVAGRYKGPASRAYLYYTSENKHWAEPLAIEIAR